VVGSSVGFHIDGDPTGPTMETLSDCRIMTRSASASSCAIVPCDSEHFKARRSVAKPDPRVERIPTDQQLVDRIGCQRAASLASSYPNAMAMTRCVINSRNSCCTLPVAVISQTTGHAEVRPNRRSAAWSRIAPPSELPCRDSNFATTGRSKYLEKGDTLSWYVRTSEGLFWYQTA